MEMNKLQTEWITTMNMHEMYINGYTTKEIGNIYNKSYNYVWRRFNKYNLPMRDIKTRNKLAYKNGKMMHLTHFKKNSTPWSKGKNPKNNLKMFFVAFGNLKRKQLHCPLCGLTFECKQYEKRKFCSQECYHTYKKLYQPAKQSRFKKGQIPYNYKGGCEIENLQIRHSRDMQKWRKSVFDRDNYTCQICGSFGKELNAHHKLPFAKYKNKRFNIDNGITLCKDCHLAYHKIIRELNKIY